MRLSVFFFLFAFCSLLFTSCSDTPDSTRVVQHLIPDSTARNLSSTSKIVGQVHFRGSLPAPKLIRMNSDPACRCNGSQEIASEEILVHAGGALSNVFVYISHGVAAETFPIPSDPVVLDQRGCQYSPHVFGIRTGQPLLILNGDSTMHNVHASAKGNRAFNIGMTKSVKSVTRRFEQPEIMIPIRCNVHPWMSAYAGVLDHPYFDVTGDEGEFEIGPLAAGDYVVSAWHERLGQVEQRIQVPDSSTQILNFEFDAKKPGTQK